MINEKRPATNMTTARGTEWWRGCAIYQIYPRSFQDTTGDGSGDLKGIAARLAHVASLGVDAIWLSPFFMSPMADMGYDISDYCAVDPLFGTIEDFDAVVAEAHRLGLKVIIDQVLSHSSDKHLWFRESRSSRDNPKADWYVWADAKPDGTAPNNWLSVFGGPAWEWDSVRKQYYLHNFLVSQPDLNFHNPEVQEAMLASLRFWLDRGVDAFRFDAVNYYFHDRALTDNPPLAGTLSSDVPDTNPYGFQQHIHDKTQPENIGFLKRVRALLDSYGERMSMGEIGDGDRSLNTVAAYTDGNDKLDMCYTFDLLGRALSPEHIRRCVEAFEHSRAGWVCWAFSNHDVARHVSRFAKPGDDGDRLAKFCATLLCALRGSICLYQGEELGLTEAEIAFEDLRDPYGIRFWPGFKGRDGCCTPMVWEELAVYAGFSRARPWLPIPQEHRVRAVSNQEYDPNSVLAHYRSTLVFRREHPVLVTGDIRFVEAPAGVLAFERGSGEDPMLCVFNIAREPMEFALPGIFGKARFIDVPGFPAPELKGKGVTLPPLGVAFGIGG
ncbi:MAG: beta-galactosidase BglA [Rhizobiaceae bacterium]